MIEYAVELLMPIAAAALVLTGPAAAQIHKGETAGVGDPVHTMFVAFANQAALAVLERALQGAREIGERLGLSPRTVDHHRSSLLRKFQMKNSVDLVNFAVRNGFVTPVKY